MESTGSYWKPVYNLLEGQGLELMLVDPAHMKAVPGRKTDVKDAQWIADSLAPRAAHRESSSGSVRSESGRGDALPAAPDRGSCG